MREFTCHVHSIVACSRHIYVWCYSSRTSRSWWITQSTQHHRSGCNTTCKATKCTLSTNMHPLLALCQCCRLQFYKLYMCSAPFANEHWICDALYISPTIANPVSMARSRCINLNLIHPEFCINCQWRDDIHSEQFCHSQFCLTHIQSKQHYIVY